MRGSEKDHLQLNQITGIWRVRIKVPLHLIPFIRGPETGLKHLTKSTGSRDEIEANKIADPIIEYYLKALDRADRLFRGDLSLEVALRKEIISDVRRSLFDADLDPTVTEDDIAAQREFEYWSEQRHAFRLIPKRRRHAQPTRT